MINCNIDGKIIDFRSFKDAKSSESTTAWARARITWSEYSGKQANGDSKYVDQYADVVVFGAQAEGMVNRFEKLGKENSDAYLIASGKPKAGEPWKNKEGKYKSNMELIANNWNMVPMVGSSRPPTTTTTSEDEPASEAAGESEDYFA